MQCDLIGADDTGSGPVPQSRYILSSRALDIVSGDTVQPITLASPPADGLMLIQFTASSAFRRVAYAALHPDRDAARLSGAGSCDGASLMTASWSPWEHAL